MDIKLWSLPERRDHIKQLRESGSQKYQTQLFFQDDMQNFPVYTVDIGFPCYRLANGRTRAQQLEVIATGDLPEDFFSTDPDSEPALLEQDKILREVVSQAGLLRTFKKVEQDRPLILSNEGYVINGNRRLCAMRLLLQQDEDAYSHFKHVQVVFLPPCTERDIKELEGRLQVQPDLRAPYSWTAEAMLYRDLRDQEWTDKQIADLYQKKVSEIRDMIAMLEDAEFYLESRGNKGKYSLVLKQEYAFRQLQKGRQKAGDDEARKQLLTTVSYLMLDDPDTAEGRLYESIPDANKFLDEIATAVRRDFSGQIPDTDDQDDDLDILGGGQGTEFADVVGVLDTPDDAEKARDTIRDTIEEMRNQERERRDATYCFRSVQQAFTKLQSSLSSLGNDQDTTGIEDALNNIEQVISDIRDWLSDASNQD